MKVVILVPNPFTDAVWTETRPYKQALALLQAGHEVVILGTGKYGQDPPREEVKFGFLIIRRPTLLHRLYSLLLRGKSKESRGGRKRQAYYEPSTRRFGHRLLDHFLQFMHDVNNLLFCVAILPQAVRQKGDVYIGTGLPGLLPGFLAARLTRARLVYDSLELWTEQIRRVPYGPVHKKVVSWVERYLCRRCDLVISISESVAEILADRYSIAKPLVIPNVQPFTDTSSSKEVRTRLASSASSRVAAYVGYLNLDRGLEQLIEAVQYLDEGINIAIIGDGVLRRKLESLAAQLKVEHRVRFIGWVTPEELPMHLASADLGVAPTQRTCLSYLTTLDNKLFSYIVAGLPLAVSDHPEKRRLVETYGIGAVFDERDPRDIARVINDLLSDPVRYQAMRERAAKVGREELNWEAIAPRYVAAIEQLQGR